jgi:heme-degrading monooxygenase HmoA
MFARYFSFKSTAENRRAIELLADEIFGYTKSLNGFVSATYLVSNDDTEYGSFTLWQSREDAEAAGASIREKVMPKLEGIVTGPPVSQVMEVYEPKS